MAIIFKVEHFNTLHTIYNFFYTYMNLSLLKIKKLYLNIIFWKIGRKLDQGWPQYLRSNILIPNL